MDTCTSSTFSSDEDAAARGAAASNATPRTTNMHPGTTKGGPIDEPLGGGGSLRQNDDGVANNSSGGSTVGAIGEDFKSQLEAQITVAKYGNRGLEAALNLICERVLDVEKVSEQSLHAIYFFEAVDRSSGLPKTRKYGNN